MGPEPLGLPPELHPPPLPATHVRLSTEPRTLPWGYTFYISRTSNSSPTQLVQHRVATSGLPLARCSPGRNGGPSAFSLGFAPPRAGPADARPSGDRSRTLIENYAPGITGLQPASSLAIRDLVSHVRTFLPPIKPGRHGPDAPPLA